MPNVITKGVKTNMTKAVSEHIKEQFSLILDHYNNIITKDLNVSLDVDDKHSKNSNRIKVSIPIKGKSIFVEDTGVNLYKVISNVVEKSNIKLEKMKYKNHKRINKRDLFN